MNDRAYLNSTIKQDLKQDKKIYINETRNNNK